MTVSPATGCWTTTRATCDPPSSWSTGSSRTRTCSTDRRGQPCAASVATSTIRSGRRPRPARPSTSPCATSPRPAATLSRCTRTAGPRPVAMRRWTGRCTTCCPTCSDDSAKKAGTPRRSRWSASPRPSRSAGLPLRLRPTSPPRRAPTAPRARHRSSSTPGTIATAALRRSYSTRLTCARAWPIRSACVNRSGPASPGVALTSRPAPKNPFDVSGPYATAMRLALAMALVPGLGTALLLVLVAGVGLPLTIGWPQLAQAHGQIQALGFVLLFIVAVGLQLFPRFLGAPLRHPSRATWGGWGLSLALVLRLVAQPLGPGPLRAAGLALAGVLLPASVLLAGSAFHGLSGRSVQPAHGPSAAWRRFMLVG